MKKFSDFLDEQDMRNGSFPQDYSFKLQINASGLFIEYLRYIVSVDGRTLKWHINKAIEMYIQSLESEK